MPSNFNRTTEEPSLYHDIEKSSTETIISNINAEDKKVAFEVEKQIPQIILLVDAAAHQLQNGGRLFYIGAGTSGRLGMVDASECPPTFGVSEDVVVGIIASSPFCQSNPLTTKSMDSVAFRVMIISSALQPPSFAKRAATLSLLSHCTVRI